MKRFMKLLMTGIICSLTLLRATASPKCMFTANCSDAKANHALDSSYLRILQEIELLLNSKVPILRFKNDRGTPINYFIADLNDPINHGGAAGDEHPRKIKFIKGHFYHVVPVLRHISFSFIVYLKKNGRLKAFNYVNCPNKGDSITEVIKYARRRLRFDIESESILARIVNYRASVEFLLPMDNYGDREPNCDTLP
jgi:hypothetical protein